MTLESPATREHGAASLQVGAMQMILQKHGDVKGHLAVCKGGGCV